MFTHKRKLVTVALGATLLVSLAACSTAETEPEETVAAEPVPTSEATSTPTTDAGQVNLLPLLEGVPETTPAGWSAGACDRLSFNAPAGWLLDADEATIKVYLDPSMKALEGPIADGSQAVEKTVAFRCGYDKTDWNGSWQAEEGAESYRLDIPGAQYAGVLINHLDATEMNMTIPGQVIEGSFQIVTPERDYYGVAFTLPANDASYEVIRQVASGISIG
jgi:hypothetical protein